MFPQIFRSEGDNGDEPILDKDFTDEEIKKVVFDLNPSKTGPDGFTASFYHQMWETVGSGVCKQVKGILNGGRSLEEWNTTSITLIPKKKNDDRLKDFRPISLCKVS